MNIEQIVSAKWLVPVVPRNLVLENHSMVIADGKILELLPDEACQKKYADISVERFDDHMLMPGFINAHTHSPMNLFRGMADDIPLMDWLQNHIWPAEMKWISETFVEDGTNHAIAEMIRSGTTCFNDMYFFPNVTGRCAEHAGIRAILGMILIDFPSAWASDSDDYIGKGLELFDHYRHHHLIHTAFAPHAPYTVSDEPFQKIQTLADELDVSIHTHLHETADEINNSIKQYGMRPIERLNKLGLITPALTAVHMTQLTNEEITLLSDNGVSVIHCPESNMKLASGFCPTQQLLDSHINVALGTDGASSNNDLNMIGEMHSSALLGKAIASDASAIDAMTAIEMATINGAKALKIDQLTGSLETGKSADFITIDLSTIETLPTFNPLSSLVYSADRTQVSDVWVAGKRLLKNQQLMTLDENNIKETAKNWHDKLTQ